MHLTPNERDVLFELAASDGEVMTNDQLLRRVWGWQDWASGGLVRTVVRRLRVNLRDNAGNPTFIFNVPRVGDRMAKGAGQVWEEK